MPQFFQNFPIINYNFGDEVTPSAFQNLSVYIDLISQITDNANFYQYYNIMDNERPDTLSYKLYNTIDHYWTFGLLNPKLLEQGWPLTNNQLYEYASKLYPHITLVMDITNNQELNIFLTKYLRGQTVYMGTLADPDAKAVIIDKNTDLGQLIVAPVREVRNIDIVEAGKGYNYSPEITITGGGGSGATATATVAEGSVTAITVINGGTGYTSNSTLTVTIEEPDLVDYAAIAQSIRDMVDGKNIGNDYYTLLNTIPTGKKYKLGDINNSGSITNQDANILDNFNISPSSIGANTRNRIVNLLRPAILSNPSLYSNWLGFTYPDLDDVQATAVASISSTSFTNGFPVNIIGENINPLKLKSHVEQYNSVHHFQAGADSDSYVDINLTNYDALASQYTPITYIDRLIDLNDDLRKIKVFKPDVVPQINAEYQKVLRASI